MTEATSIYRAVMVEVERRRLQLGWPMWQLDDAAGTQDGYYAKGLYPDGPNGRQMRWETLQLIIDAMFPGGFEIVLRDKKSGCMTASKQRSQIRFAVATYDRKSQRELMRDLARMGAAKGGAARAKRLPKWRRRAIARAAARAKWRRRRETIATPPECRDAGTSPAASPRARGRETRPKKTAEPAEATHQ